MAALFATCSSAAVVYSVSGSTTTACPGTIGAPLGSLQFFSAAGGTVAAGSTITMFITPAILTSSPTLTGAPPGVTMFGSGSVLTIAFGSNTTVAAASFMTIVGLAGTVPVIEGPITANLTSSSTSEIQLIPNSHVIAFVSNTACIGRIATSVASLEFGAPIGGNPPAQSFTISNGIRAGTNLSPVVTATSTPPGWLTVQQSVETAGVTVVTVVIESKTLPINTYTGTITITAPTADNSPVNIPVTLKVGRTGRIDLSATKLTFIAEPGKNPPSQTLVVSNGGTGVLNPDASAFISSGGPWLFVTRTPEPSEPTVFTVNVFSSTLAPGTYNAVITVASDIAFNSPQLVPVELTVRAPAPTIALSRTTLAFSTDAGKNPAPQTFVVSNSDIGTLAWRSTVATAGGAWLTLSPASGTAPTTATASVNVANLQPGTYNGTIAITSSSEGITNSPQNITVSLTVRAPSNPTLALAPAALSFTADQGGKPAPQSFTVSNTGGGTLVWSATVATSGGDWLTLTPSSGTAPTVVQVTINSSALAPGAYEASITVASTSSGITNSPQTIPVSLTVRSLPPVIALSVSALTFTALPAGSVPASRTVSLSNGGGGTLAWAATVSTATGGNWLSVTPAAGTAPSTLTVTADPSRLPAGRYTGTVSIRSTGTAASNTPQEIAVELVVDVPRINSAGCGAASQPGCGIINAAHGAANGLAPGALITVYGSNLALAPLSAGPGAALPDELGGTVVRIGAFRARLLYVSPTQINAQVPVELTDAAAQVRVSVGTSESPPVALSVLGFDPGLFTFSGEPGGPAAALRGSDFGPISAASPAQRGSVIILYATGLGPVVPSVSSGQLAAASEPLNRTVETPVVQIGGSTATVLFSGLAPNFVGLYQINVQIPADAPTGDSVPVFLISGGRGSNTARLAIR